MKLETRMSRRKMLVPVYASVPVPTPQEFAAYLGSSGWEPGITHAGYWQLFGKEFDVVEVPLKGDAPDYPRCALTLAENIGRLDGRSPAEVLRDVVAQVEGHSANGSLCPTEPSEKENGG